MRTYYYASEELEPYTSPQKIIPNYGLTTGMLRRIVENHAAGSPPFTIFIPSDLAWHIVDELPKGLFRVEIQRNDTMEPVGQVTIYFSYDHSASLFYRRQITAVILDEQTIDGDHLASTGS